MTTSTTTMMMMDVRLVSKRRVKLIFQGTYRLSGNGIKCLKIIEAGCNLKQLDVEADRKCISFLAVKENADENQIPFSVEKRKRKSSVPISQNLVTDQLRT